MGNGRSKLDSRCVFLLHCTLARLPWECSCFVGLWGTECFQVYTSLSNYPFTFILLALPVRSTNQQRSRIEEEAVTLPQQFLRLIIIEALGRWGEGFKWATTVASLLWLFGFWLLAFLLFLYRSDKIPSTKRYDPGC